MKKDKFVSVIIPIAKRDIDLLIFLNQTQSVLEKNFSYYEIIVVDVIGGIELLTALRSSLDSVHGLRVIRLSRNLSFDVAATAGMETSIGDYVAILDPTTDPPELIPAMVDKASEGGGVVVGVDENRPQKTWFGKLIASAFHAYVRRYLGGDLIPNSTQYRILSRRVVNALTGIKGKYRQLRFLTSIVGYGSATYSYKTLKSERRPIPVLISEASDLLIANSIHPLRAVSLLGLAASGLNLIYLFYVVTIYIIKKDIAPGWTTLSLQNGGMFFLLFLLLSVLGEYIGRILAETRSQPLYNIHDELNSSVLLKTELMQSNVVDDSK
jgi:glycosyltransferase involved in cell wall biosynthesis